MCQIGEPGTQLEAHKEIRFKRLQTIVLSPIFVEKMKSVQLSRFKQSEILAEHDERKFILLPRWEQQFLGLQRRQCENRTVLAYSKPTGMKFDCFMDTNLPYVNCVLTIFPASFALI